MRFFLRNLESESFACFKWVLSQKDGDQNLQADYSLVALLKTIIFSPFIFKHTCFGTAPFSRN